MKRLRLGLLALLVFSCTSPSDPGTPPVVGGDTSAPTPANPVTITGISYTGATISWLGASDDVSNPAELSYKVVLGLASGDIDTIAKADGITSSLRVLDWTAGASSVSPANLIPGTTYHTAVLVKDLAGNKALYTIKSFTTNQDTAAPTGLTGLAATGISANSLSLAWDQGSDDVTAQNLLQYKVVRAPASTDIDTAVKADGSGITLVQDWTAALTSASVINLDQNTTYYFAVLVRDQAGNKGLYGPISASTNSTPDTTPPVPGTGPTAPGKTASSVSLAWNQGSDNVTSAVNLQYRVVKSLSSTAIDTLAEVSAITGSDLVQDWTGNLTAKTVDALAPGTVYYFNVAVRDSAGNAGIYTLTPLAVTTLSDVEAPTGASGLTVTSVTGSSANLSWTKASDNVTLQGQLKYKVVSAAAAADLDTIPEASAATDRSGGWQTDIGNYTVSGLTSVSAYAVAVLVQDERGNAALYAPVMMETATKTSYPHETKVGYNYPPTGNFSAVDLNGTAPGKSWDTQTWPLGAHYNGSDLEVAVWAPNATRLLLEIYNREHYWASDRISGLPAPKDGQGQAVYDYWMEKGSDGVWRAKVTGAKTYVTNGVLYAFRAWGANWPFDSAWTRGNSSAGYLKDWQSSGYPPVMVRFNPNKVLTDPYSYELSHDTEYPALVSGGESGSLYGTGGADSKKWDGTSANSVYSGPISTGGVTKDRRDVDTGRFVSKSYALDISNFAAVKPNIPEKDLIVYEAHVRGLTKHSSSSNLTTILSGISDFAGVPDVPAAYRGTYKGAAYLAKYFKALGINAVELLPVHETRNDLNDSFTGTGSNPGNYWGYMTYSYFAPDRNYAYDKSPGGPSREFQEMAASFAAEGIEIWIDVVYNHSGEGGNWGSADITGFTSYGGFGASDYYHINKDNGGGLVDGATGCGNQLNFSEGRTQTHNLVKDSLTHFIDKLGVSGFRFDLAAVLARDTDSVANDANYWSNVGGVKASLQGGKWVISHSLPVAIAALGASKNAKMVAETWDMWAYPVGMYPAGWMEWNGRYRDSTRKLLNWGNTTGHDGVSANDAFNGDYDHYFDNGGPQKTVNFLVAHDGFTLADLVSYGSKTNTSRNWPFGPSDGGESNNISTDSGSDQSIRRQRIRNLFTWQMFSRGTPMIVWGDEFGRTQNGNNNPYNIDSVATYNNYSFINTNEPQLSPTGTTGEVYHNNLGTDTKADNKNNLFLFNRALMNLRKNEPGLRNGDYSVSYDFASETGGTLAGDARARRIHIKGSSVSGGSDYVVCVNMWTDTVNYTLPTPPSGKNWYRIIDTAAWAENQGDSPDGNIWSDSAAWLWNGSPYGVGAWSIVVFKAK